MGLRRRGDIWFLRKVIDGRRYERSTGFSDLKAARRRAAEIEVELRSGALGWTTNCPTFADWWKTYERTHAPSKRPRTQVRDRGTIAHALPHFGAKRLDAIRPSDCVKYLHERRQTVAANPGRKNPQRISEGTVQRERRLLQAVLQRAVEDGLLERNPWRGIERAPEAVRARLLLPDAEVAIRAALSPRFQRFLTFMLQTGLRLEECRSIDPARDIKNGCVHVVGKFGRPRAVPLTLVAQKAIDDQLAADGRLWQQNPQRLREVLATAAKRAGTHHLSPHDLRHTFGHRWLVAGGDIYTLSKLLGHSSVNVTEQHYAHLLKEDLASKMMAVMETR
jgi:integrase/recombinase XerD